MGDLLCYAQHVSLLDESFNRDPSLTWFRHALG